MTRARRTKIEKPLTEVELQLMNAIWDLGECTVKDVQSRLSQERELAYTSVATVMKILEGKGFLESSKSDRAHSYRAVVSRAEYEALSLRHLANHLFRGNPSSMVMKLIHESRLSPDELKAIRKILNERLDS